MIQRIQTVYLLLAAAALGLQFVLPYSIAPTDSPLLSTSSVFSDGVFNLLDNLGLLGLSVLGLGCSLAAVFLFKNRPLQGRIAAMSVLVTVLLMALALFVFFNIGKSLPEGAVVLQQAGWAMPLLACVLNWLAVRSIAKDEKLVRSMDRLR